MKKIACGLVLGLLSMNIYAKSLDSGPYYFKDAQIPHKNGENLGYLYYKLESLPQEGIFDINCDIENPNYKNQYPVVISAPGKIDGKISSTGLYRLNHYISKFSTQAHTYGSSPPRPTLTFSSYDDKDDVYIKNCIATYAAD